MLLQDTGLPQQVEIFEQLRRRTDRTPPVLDARDVLENPRRLLGLLCEAIGVEFTETMLHVRKTACQRAGLSS